MSPSSPISSIRTTGQSRLTLSILPSTQGCCRPPPVTNTRSGRPRAMLHRLGHAGGTHAVRVCSRLSASDKLGPPAPHLLESFRPATLAGISLRNKAPPENSSSAPSLKPVRAQAILPPSVKGQPRRLHQVIDGRIGGAGVKCQVGPHVFGQRQRRINPRQVPTPPRFRKATGPVSPA